MVRGGATNSKRLTTEEKELTALYAKLLNVTNRRKAEVSGNVATGGSAAAGRRPGRRLVGGGSSGGSRTGLGGSRSIQGRSSSSSGGSGGHAMPAAFQAARAKNLKGGPSTTGTDAAKQAMAAAIAKMKNKGGIAKTTKFKRSQSLSARAPKRQKISREEQQPKTQKPVPGGDYDNFAKAGGAGGVDGADPAGKDAAASGAVGDAAAASSNGNDISNSNKTTTIDNSAEKKDLAATAEPNPKSTTESAEPKKTGEVATEEPTYEEDYSKERELVVYDDDF